MGYESIIWTVHRFPGSIEDVLILVNTFYGRFAIAMPEFERLAELSIPLAQKGIPIYVHTINNKDDMLKYSNDFKITEIYTDFLAP